MTDRGLYGGGCSGDHHLGLAPHDAVNGRGSSRRAGAGPNRSGSSCARGLYLAGCGVAFPRTPEHAGVHVVGLLDGGTRRWLVCLDRPASQAADVAWYGLRMWIEHGYGQFKSAGWQWQKTRITEPIARTDVVGHRLGDLLGGRGRRATRARRGAGDRAELPATDTGGRARQARDANDWSACSSKVSPSSWTC